MAGSNANGGKGSGKKATPAHDGYRLGGKTRGGKHADRGGVGDTQRTAGDRTGRTTKKIGRPPEGRHRKKGQ